MTGYRSQASRRVVQVLPRLAPGKQTRNMSGHGSIEDNTKYMQYWFYTTVVAIPCVAGFGYYTWINGHHEHEHAPKYPYLKKRDKKFPWGSNCDLLDFNCGKEGHH